MEELELMQRAHAEGAHAEHTHEEHKENTWRAQAHTWRTHGEPCPSNHICRRSRSCRCALRRTFAGRCGWAAAVRVRNPHAVQRRGAVGRRLLWPQGCLPTTHASLARQNLGPCGRALHKGVGLWAVSSLHTARLRLDPPGEEELLRIRGPVGVEAMGEVDAAPAGILCADMFRSTYVRARTHRCSAASCMRPAGTWCRAFANIRGGDV